MLAGEHRAGAREPGLYLVGNEYDVVGATPLQEGGKKAGRRFDESSFTLDRFDDQGGEIIGADVGLDVRDRTVGG